MVADGPSVGAHLALADLVTDPEPALRAYVTALLDPTAGAVALRVLRDLLVSLVGDVVAGLETADDRATTLESPPYGWLPGDPA